MCYVDVIVPLLVPTPYTYKVEEETLGIGIGSIVRVYVGKILYTGLVVRERELPPHEGISYKNVSDVFSFPKIPQSIVKLWEWISLYYMCTMGEVWRACLPSSLEENVSELDNRTYRTRTLVAVSEPFLASPKGVLLSDTEEEWKLFLQRYSKRKQMIRVAAAVREEKNIRYFTRSYIAEKYNTSPAIVKSLIESGFLRIVDASSVSSYTLVIPEEELKQSQQAWRRCLEQSAQNIQIQLIHGEFDYSTPYTSLPIHWIEGKIEAGGNILLLYPSTELLSEALPYLRILFPEKVELYDANSSGMQKESVWNKSLSGSGGYIFVGIRSVVLLPIASLKGIIVLGEEDSFYKQIEPNPRYSAVHTALMMARLMGKEVDVLLCSRIPSLESYIQAKRGTYRLIPFDYVNPSKNRDCSVDLVDLREAFDKNRVSGRLLSFELQSAIQKTLSESGKVLILHHRYGYAKGVSCIRCGHVESCPDCKIPLKIYKEGGELVCAICGYHKPKLEKCAECEGKSLKEEGTGIERLADEVRELYPNVPVRVEDSKSNFGWEDADIILSPKGRPSFALLHGADCIAVTNLDILFARPDFRAEERVFQCMYEWRYTPKHLKRVVIQTFNPHHPVIDNVLRSDHESFTAVALKERYSLLYPPFSRMISISVESKDRKEALAYTREMISMLVSNLSDCTTLGPAPFPVKKVNASIGFRIWVKVPVQFPIQDVKQMMVRIQNSVYALNRPSSNLRVFYDVDPVW
ncbi:hypothetical protein HQ29_05795 [Porphyromonas canoris]|uniref:replication restart helicase PriA n=1 Tax=Porphyromonas canoris TaxID=36875 RepID=UPI00051DC5E6|nr:primosomal protein N' [Porphyromonas canoris]KGL52425.1 hypothetical protein HQ29_05795 [Porphyromonas canoris]